jgi:hypothetical protein
MAPSMVALKQTCKAIVSGSSFENPDAQAAKAGVRIV